MMTLKDAELTDAEEMVVHVDLEVKAAGLSGLIMNLCYPVLMLKEALPHYPQPDHYPHRPGPAEFALLSPLTGVVSQPILKREYQLLIIMFATTLPSSEEGFP